MEWHSPNPNRSQFHAMKTTVHTPRDLFLDQLRDIYSMEGQICESMPRLAAMCTDRALREMIESHAEQNRDQLTEIVAIFERWGQSPGDDSCKAIAGLIQGGTTHLEAVEDPNTRDLMMIAHCLRIEHYEMAAYVITGRLAGRLGMMRESEILSGLLAEETEMACALLGLEPDLFQIANSER